MLTAAGLLRNADGTVERRFRTEAELVPLSLVLRQHPSGRNPADDAVPGQVTLQPGERAVFLGMNHLGATATVDAVQGAGVDASGQPVTASGVPLLPCVVAVPADVA